MKREFLVTMLLFIISVTYAQDRPALITPCCQTIDRTVTELLRLISNKPGEEKDTAALRALFLPTARFTVHTQDTTAEDPLQMADLNELSIMCRTLPTRKDSKKWKSAG